MKHEDWRVNSHSYTGMNKSLKQVLYRIRRDRTPTGLNLDTSGGMQHNIGDKVATRSSHSAAEGSRSNHFIG